MNYFLLLTVTTVLLTGLAVESNGAEAVPGTETMTCDNPALCFAPYVWKQTGSGESVRAEAAMPGAYLRAVVTNTTRSI